MTTQRTDAERMADIREWVECHPIDESRFIPIEGLLTDDLRFLLARVSSLESAPAAQFAAAGWTVTTIAEACEEMERLSGMARSEAARRIAAESALDAAQRDANRLDWLDKQPHCDLTRVLHDDEDLGWTVFDPNGLPLPPDGIVRHHVREAIDAARSGEDSNG